MSVVTIPSAGCPQRCQGMVVLHQLGRLEVITSNLSPVTVNMKCQALVCMYFAAFIELYLTQCMSLSTSDPSLVTQDVSATHMNPAMDASSSHPATAPQPGNFCKTWQRGCCRSISHRTQKYCCRCSVGQPERRVRSLRNQTVDEQAWAYSNVSSDFLGLQSFQGSQKASCSSCWFCWPEIQPCSVK